MLASSNVCLEVFAQKYEYFEEERANLNLRRNYVYLFDNMKNEVMKLDTTIGISLLERREQEKLHSKLERIHPLIPHASLGAEDRAALHLQPFGLKPNLPADATFQVHHHSSENQDPNLLIRQSKHVQPAHVIKLSTKNE